MATRPSHQKPVWKGRELSRIRKGFGVGTPCREIERVAVRKRRSYHLGITVQKAVSPARQQETQIDCGTTGMKGAVSWSCLDSDKTAGSSRHMESKIEGADPWKTAHQRSDDFSQKGPQGGQMEGLKKAA